MIKSKSKIFLLILTLTITSSVSLFTNSLLFNSNNDIPHDKNIDYDNLRISGPEINITTPVNTTYNKPMSGYHPGTYGFENDENGDIPSGWAGFIEADRETIVTASYNGHNKVFKIYDNTPSQDLSPNSPFAPQSYGTVEYWWLVSDTSPAFTFILHNSSIGWGVVVTIRDNYFKYRNSSVYHTISGAPIPQNNQWYHIQVDFRCNGAPTYQGLNESRFFVYIDGIKYGEYPFVNDVNNVDMSVFSTGTTSTLTGYIDALGYSWDPEYSIGDNLNEGLLLSYDIGFTPDWQGYSLDGQANDTILGNTTILLPGEGLHRIQVFGNDSGGVMYESNVRYFSIKYLNIITPENITYYGPMSGYYPATNGFENAQDGDNPKGWFIIEDGGTCNVVKSEGNHFKVVELSDISGTDNVLLNQTFTGKSYGTVEYWWSSSDSNKELAISMWNGNIWVISIIMKNNEFVYWDGGWQSFGVSATNDTWYHIRIDFECAIGGYQGLSQYKWQAYINGKNYGAYDLINNESEIDSLNFNTNPIFSNYEGYIDAVGFSWDPNYNIGDNLNEGLLLSYDIGFTPDWLGYSLDGRGDIILGNTTIPLPSEGIHRIRVFGNDSGGVMYESNVRYFTTLYHPEISINSPTHFEFFGYTAPNFNISIIEMNLHSRWYTLDSGATNITFGGFTGQINQTEWDKYGNGTVIIRFYANDTWGLEGYSEVIVRKDTLTPSSSINFTPHSGNDIVNESTTFSLTATDGFGSGVSYIRYKINDSNWITYNTPFTLTNYPYGDVLISYQAVDELDNYEPIQTILVHRTDTIAPSSSILFLPHSGMDMVNESTTFSLIADDDEYGAGVSYIRYKINDSSWITYSTPFTLANYPYGDVLISYQAVDELGNYESIQTIIVHRTDTITPTSTISFTPYRNTDIVIRSTNFTITANDDEFGSGISHIRYKINDSVWYDYIGPFDLSGYDYGEYVITYQAIDNAGNIEDEHSIMVTLITEPSQPGIPGYHLFIMLSVIGMISAVIIKKKFK